jgi:hypothetical protein
MQGALSLERPMVCRTAPFALLLLACAELPSTGQPFTPVAVGEPVSGGAVGLAAAADPAFEIETFKMDSEALHAAAKGKDEPKATPAAPSSPAPAAAAEPVAAAPAAATPAPATPAAPPPPAAVTPLAAISPAPSPWPVRLVMTLPQAQPPRAILGLPGGKEIVVTPGSMVPEEGLVVMSVGRDRVQLARIQPQGDHAAVAELTLTTQY